VTLPPGLARLATNPTATGSLLSVTIGMVFVCASAARVVAADDDCDFAGDQFGDESVQLARLARASIFDEQVPPLDVTEVAQTLAQRIRTQIAEADR